MGYLPVDGEKLKSLRDAGGFSSAEKLGEAAGKYLDGGKIPKRTIERYEAGENGRPDYIQAIAKALEVNWTELLTPAALRIARDYVPTYITGKDEREFRLLYKSFECYDRIFPNDQERNDPQDMVRWIHKRRRAESSNDPCRDIYAVLHAEEDVIGMAYIFIHLDHPWAFGAYFGITANDRVLSRADKFLEAIVEHIIITNPRVKAIVFEIDSVDYNVLGEALSGTDHKNESEELLSALKASPKNRRNFLR